MDTTLVVYPLASLNICLHILSFNLKKIKHACMLFHFCFAALSNSRGEYLLNGDFVVSMFKREVKVGNAVIEYSGSDHVVERINCTDRIEEEIIIQVIWLY